MEKVRTLDSKLWKFLKVFSFLAYGIICLTEGIKLYHRFVQNESIPQWSIYLFLSVAVLIPGLLGFAMKNKGAGARFFVGTGRVLASIVLLFGCILSQRGLERYQPVITEQQIASHTLQSAQSKEEDARLAIRQANEIQATKVVDTTPPSFQECLMNGRKYHSSIPYDIIKKEIQDKCSHSVFSYGSDKH